MTCAARSAPSRHESQCRRSLDDSKKLDRETREKLYAKICACAEVAVAMAPPARIDRDNILRASLWALGEAQSFGDHARPKLARVMEPRAATPSQCLDALRELAQAGVPTSVMVAPIIPAINDAEIERILDAASAVGVQGAGYVLLRLPIEVRDLFREWFMANFPDRYRHVFGLIAICAAARITIPNSASA